MSIMRSLCAREILDSRGNPTLEVDVVLDDGSQGRAAVPSGASTGSREAVELRDGGHRFLGKGVSKAIANVEGEIAATLSGLEIAALSALDARLIALDGTPNKARLGANAILGVSMACARALSQSCGQPLYRFLAEGREPLLPVPMFNVLNGGVHADNNVDFQEFMIAPVGASDFPEALRYGAETYASLKKLLRSRGLSVAIGDEGGFAPHLRSNEEAVELILEAIAGAGLEAGRDIVIALDPAASEFHDGSRYVFGKTDGGSKTTDEMIALYRRWLDAYPAIWSIEDGLAEDDWSGWQKLTADLGQRTQLVGDDILVTDPAVIRRAVAEGVGNAALIKLNQIGTVTETLEAIRIAQAAGWGTVISHRSGETSDDFIADLAVATAAGQIKSGAPARGERTAKYNQLLRIHQQLGSEARYAGHHFSEARRFRP